MKKIICLITVITIYITTVFSYAFGDDIYYPESILVLGDSISTGYGLEGYNAKDDSKNYSTKSYANLLRDKYNLLEGYKNYAEDGFTSDDLIDNLKREKYDDSIKNSDYIIISIGGNDIIQYIYKCVGGALGLDDDYDLSDIFKIDLTKPEVFKNILNFITTKECKKIEEETISEFKDNISETVKYIHSVNKDTRIIFQTVFNPVYNIKQIALFNSMVEDVIIQLNNTIKDNSSYTDENDVIINRYYYVDIYEAFNYDPSKYTNILQNDIHPNQEGHKVIAQKIDSLINNIFLVEICPTFSDGRKCKGTTDTENKNVTKRLIIYFCLFSILTLSGIAVFRLSCKKASSK